MEIHRPGRLAEEERSYIEFLRKPSMSAGLYRLSAGAVDSQVPHREDEVYYVLAGRAKFITDDEDTQVEAGDVIYVSAGEAHRFHAIEEDLELLVVFSPAEGSNSGG
jgi:mannose-6-phosphate isomerase-like protein (cupin superfamily)